MPKGDPRGIAQLVEHSSLRERDAGSNPATPTVNWVLAQLSKMRDPAPAESDHVFGRWFPSSQFLSNSHLLAGPSLWEEVKWKRQRQRITRLAWWTTRRSSALSADRRAMSTQMRQNAWVDGTTADSHFACNGRVPKAQRLRSALRQIPRGYYCTCPSL